MSAELLQIDLWCRPVDAFVAARLEPGFDDCLPDGVTSAAVRLELVAGASPRVVDEVGTGFGACAAEALDPEIVLYDERGGALREVSPLPPGTRCEVVLAGSSERDEEAAWNAASTLLPPPSRTERWLAAIGRMLSGDP